MLNAGHLLEQIMLRESLSQTEAYSLFNSIMHGEQSELMIASVLTALKMKKESQKVFRLRQVDFIFDIFL